MNYFDGLSMGELGLNLKDRGHRPAAIEVAIYQALNRLELFVGVPLRNLGLDDSIGRLNLIPGLSQVEATIAMDHRPHFVGATTDGGQVIVWDVYVEDTHGIDVDLDLEFARLTYAGRQRLDPTTPAECVLRRGSIYWLVKLSN